MRRFESVDEKLAGDGVPLLMQGGMAALGVGLMATTAPVVLLAAVPLAVYMGRRIATRADAEISNMIDGKHVEGNSIYRRYNIDTAHGMQLLDDKYGAKGVAFAREYQAIAKMAGLERTPTLLVMEPRVRMRNSAAILKQPPRKESLGAFAVTSRDGSLAAVAVGDVFLQEMSPAEIRATIAHEMAHIKGRHTGFSFINLIAETASVIGAVGVVGAALLGGAAVVPALAVAGAMVGLTKTASIMQSRYHEKICDRAAAVITGTPMVLSQVFNSLSMMSFVMRQELEDHRARIEGRMPKAVPTRAPLINRMLAAHPKDQVRTALLQETQNAHSTSFWRARSQHLAQAFNECAARDAAKTTVTFKPTAEQVGFLRLRQGN